MSNLLKIIEEEMKLRNYSNQTIKAYTGVVKDLHRYFKPKNLRSLNQSDIKRYLLHKIDKNLSSQTISLYANAINYLFLNIYKDKVFKKIKHPKRNKGLPVVLAKKEILLILNQIKNPKHRLIIQVAYGSGLRVSEVVNLKVQDIDTDSKTILVKNGKGKKDRITVLSGKICNDLNKIMVLKKPKGIVFESERGGKLTTTTLQKIFKMALQKSGVKKPATFHSLRHSFATHLLENGVDIRYLQELLGHQNIRTTQGYTQVTNPQLKNIKSPLE